jgi:hypothetical protein
LRIDEEAVFGAQVMNGLRQAVEVSSFFGPPEQAKNADRR